MQRKEKEKEKDKDKNKAKENLKILKYDLVDGLLPEIRKTCGYPMYVEEVTTKGSSKKKKMIIEEEWTMPEAQNCGLCSTGGDILCCELCPASFHLTCIGLEESDIPEGNFYCNRCKHMPENVRLFPPEKCSTSTSPTYRIENENRRNWETIEFQYNRFRQEEVDAGNAPKLGISEEEAIRRSFPDRNLLKALGMANHMDFQYSLPLEYLRDRQYLPVDARHGKRVSFSGEICAHCKLKDEWSTMLKCDFCDRKWHQKCVQPTLVALPKLHYWMCPAHPETVLESLWQGDQVSKHKRLEMYKKFRRTNYSDSENLKVFRAFHDKARRLFYPPDEKTELVGFLDIVLFKRRSYRKGGRGKRKKEFSFLSDSYAIKGIVEPMETLKKLVETPKKQPEQPAEREENTQEVQKAVNGYEERSKLFTEEELIMSIMPFDASARAEFLTEKLLGTDVETFYNHLSERDLIRIMRRDLDPIETVRGSGIQGLKDFQEKPTARRKIKADVEPIIHYLGLGSAHADRRINTPSAEAFFRRCAPPPGAQEALRPGVLREIVLNSQMEAEELIKVYRIHESPEQLQHLVFLAFDHSFESREQRDSFFPSSMTPWSKEPLGALMALWLEDNGGLVEERTMEVEQGGGRRRSDGDSTDEEGLNETQKVENPSDEPSLQYSNDTGPLELHASRSAIQSDQDDIQIVSEKLASVKIITRPEVYEKAESIHGAEGYWGEPDDPILESRLSKSMSDLEDIVRWSRVRMAIRDYVLRNSEEDIMKEHSYYGFVDSYRAYSDEDEMLEEAPKVEAAESIPEEVERTDKKEEEPWRRRSSTPNSCFVSPATPPSHSFAEDESPGTIVRKRGRPVGSKNRKEGEATPKRKRNPNPTGTGRGRGGRGGRPRGVSRGRGGRGSGSVASSVSRPSIDQEDLAELLNSSDTLEDPETTGKRRLRDEVEKIRHKFCKMVISRSLENLKDEYTLLRDEALENWTEEEWKQHKERCLKGRMNSLIPYDPRLFLPAQRVHAKIVIDGELPVAVQRCLTKFGTAQDCHVRLDRFSKKFCHFLADYHCDIIREYHTNDFYLSTLANATVIVDGVVVRRQTLTALEDAERRRTMRSPPLLPSNIKCRCQVHIDQETAHQENWHTSDSFGIVKLKHEARVQMNNQWDDTIFDPFSSPGLSYSRQRRSEGESTSLPRALRSAMDPEYEYPEASVDPFASSFVYTDDASLLNAVSAPSSQEPTSSRSQAIEKTTTRKTTQKKLGYPKERTLRRGEYPANHVYNGSERLSQVSLRDFLTEENVESHRGKRKPFVKTDKQTRMSEFLFVSQRVDKGAREFGLKTKKIPVRGSKKKRESLENLEVEVEDVEIVEQPRKEVLKTPKKPDDDFDASFALTTPSPYRRAGKLQKTTKLANFFETSSGPTQKQPTVTANDPSIYLNESSLLNATLSPIRTRTPVKSLAETVPVFTPSPAKKHHGQHPEDRGKAQVKRALRNGSYLANPNPQVKRAKQQYPTFDCPSPITLSDSEERINKRPQRPTLTAEEAKRKQFGAHMAERHQMMQRIVDEKFVEERENGGIEKRRAEMKPGEVVRNKEMRKNLMHGAACPCCRGYYEGLNMGDEEKRDYINKVSRHRYVHQALPDTPEKYWDLTMGPRDDDEDEEEERGGGSWQEKKKSTAGIQNWN
ncbi:unnamed protein product [Caenorhabditis sp. 36 PRJEB53466]|nr:unnamed protein product [Caenorhabditis sp. 36 PRJEB53466]